MSDNITSSSIVLIPVDNCNMNMFIWFQGFGYQSELELRVAEAARRQYNKLKMQTKAEIRQTIDQLLVGEFIVRKINWIMTWH